MNLEEAIKKVLKENPGFEIKKTYMGVLAGEKVFGFVISETNFNKTVLVYSDGTMTEPTGHMANVFLNSLKEIN